MAYIETSEVKHIRDLIKAEFPSYKWSITREHHSTLQVTLMESDLSFKEDYIQVNHYYVEKHYEDNPKAKKVLLRVLEIIQGEKPCFDRNAGDPHADYGDNNYFISLHVGKWNKPHVTVSGTTANRAKYPQIIQI